MGQKMDPNGLREVLLKIGTQNGMQTKRILVNT